MNTHKEVDRVSMCKAVSKIVCSCMHVEQMKHCKYYIKALNASSGFHPDICYYWDKEYGKCECEEAARELKI